jgi:hypothetical protein
LKGFLRLDIKPVQLISPTLITDKKFTSPPTILLCSTTCITSAPWTREMPSRPPCPKAADARRRRPGAGHLRAWGSRGYFGGRCCLTAEATTDHSPDASRLRHPGTCLPQDVYKRYLLSRIALRLLKIIGPRLVGQERKGNAQLLRYGSERLGQNFFFYFIVLDRFSCLPQDVHKHRMFTNTAKTANLSSQRA